MTDEWGPEIEHDGGPCPVHPNSIVKPTYRYVQQSAKGVRITQAPARRLAWHWDGQDDDIIAYRVKA